MQQCLRGRRGQAAEAECCSLPRPSTPAAAAAVTVAAAAAAAAMVEACWDLPGPAAGRSQASAWPAEASWGLERPGKASPGEERRGWTQC